MAGIPLAIGAISAVSQYRNAKAQQKAIAQQSAVQADEIAQQKGEELTARARAARRERGAMRAAASESGINLGSGSFLAALSTSALNEMNDSGLIIKNGEMAQRARIAQTNSLFASHPVPNPWLQALQVGASAFGSYQRGVALQNAGAQTVT